MGRAASTDREWRCTAGAALLTSRTRRLASIAAAACLLAAADPASDRAQTSAPATPPPASQTRQTAADSRGKLLPPELAPFRVLRPVRVTASPAAASACAVLDAPVFAHSGSAGLNDLRLFRLEGTDAATTTQVPFAVTESSAARSEEAQASATGVTAHPLGPETLLSFTLHMPPQPYTAVELSIAAHDFVGRAHVLTADGVDRGTFALYDFTSQGLGHSLAMDLQETTASQLQVELRLWPAPGTPPRHFAADAVRGASVPPSREAQTVYTTVAESRAWTRNGASATSQVQVPAHVPIERIAFVPNPQFSANFRSAVRINAHPEDSEAAAALDRVSGVISSVRLPAAANPAGLPIAAHSLAVDAVLLASLRSYARLDVTVESANAGPFPLTAVQVQMRQRELCFPIAGAGANYVLAYGNDDVETPAPGYQLPPSPASPLPATLGPEQANVVFREANPEPERRPTMLWIAILALFAAFGSMALRVARRRQAGRRG